MPTKSKRKGRHKSKACPETESPVNKKIIDYFPPSPPPSNNNSSCTSLQFPSDTSIYNGTLPKNLTDSKDGVCTISCLPTPEDSPDKVDMPIKPEPPDGGGLSKPDFSEDAESYREPGLCASASSSHSTNEDKVTGHSALQEKKSNSKRQARKPKSKPEEVKPNHLVTDFFPVRKSSRKTAKELQVSLDMFGNIVLCYI
ncbi:hypothetical protein EB796_001995 [Bugula neritina]|uniref:Uncharacterized protein n=1 Tax=Bugula neritina TaxID=10212 RepID=A0A7J7KNM7_BUGNE|nr:hypothetical protein EB796_001995 [Bugula neritina]